MYSPNVKFCEVRMSNKWIMIKLYWTHYAWLALYIILLILLKSWKVLQNAEASNKNSTFSIFLSQITLPEAVPVKQFFVNSYKNILFSELTNHFCINWSFPFLIIFFYQLSSTPFENIAIVYIPQSQLYFNLNFQTYKHLLKKIN